MDFQDVSKKLDTYLDTMIEWQRGLTAIPALGPLNGGQGEMEKCRFLRSLLEPLAPDEIIEINAPDDQVESGFRPNLIALFKGKSSQRKIWILSHMDIVPPGDYKLWDQDPYKVRVEGDKIIGRGVEDNQHGLVSSMAAMAAFRDLGFVPPYDVALAFVADEETGSYYGLDYVLRERLDLFSPDDLIIVPDAGNEDGTMIEVAEKSMLWLKVIVLGKQCHASTPEKGKNALRAASRMIVDLESLLTTFDARDPLFSPPISTLEPTKKKPTCPTSTRSPAGTFSTSTAACCPNIRWMTWWRRSSESVARRPINIGSRWNSKRSCANRPLPPRPKTRRW